MIDSTITVGIPFTNETNASHLKKSINSIVNQTLIVDCIHLIQDGEISEELSDLINTYSDKYSNIQILSFPKSGLPYVLNQSIKRCKTKYYARMDSDDIAFTSRIEKQVRYLNDNTNIDILGTWSKEFQDDNNLDGGFINKRPDDYNEIKNFFHYRSAFIHPTVVFRLSLFEKIGFYNETFYTAQDIELCGRALQNNIQISNLQEPLLYYRVEGIQSRRSNLGAIKRQIFSKYSYNTLSIKYNVLKILSILLRFLPVFIRKWSYKKLRY